MRLSDFALGLIVLAAGIAIYLSSLSFTPIPGQAYGAETMPRTIALGTVLLGVFLIARGAMRLRTEPWLAISDWTGQSGPLLRIGFAILLVVLYIAFSDQIGFVVSAFVLMLGLMLAMRANPLIAIAAAALATIVAQQAFGRLLLLVPLPRNPALDFLW